ncbi:MAG: alpha/beta hydrolase [Roseovarius sp.]|uniref:alpha/beta hydrolase n=1 Tax=Roseovarius sp. TaxID=1486281 RepID=UPI001B5A867E|nr:alpha/beta hydrolase [Roseovarius sp.]MBQ0750961.1 alpha/beta hydrolase [Roseovarius sp.]MBQ0809158.1 alpha/beta hydrolase [Roseovarius sp.]
MSLTNYSALTHIADEGAPLVFAFHGTGGDERQFFDLARQLVPKGSVVSMRGDVSEGGAARFFRRTGEGVYDMDDLARRTERMVAFIAAHKAMHPAAAVYGFGYSNGANILASVVMAHPDLFERVALLHPLIPWSPAPVDLKDLFILITAGRRDPICPWPLSDALITWAEQQGACVTTHIHEGGHELRQEEIAALSKLMSQ